MPLVCPTLSSLPLKKGTRALVRVDYNIVDPAQDDFRIRVTLPLIKKLLVLRARVILVSHRGRPGPRDRGKPEFSLATAARQLTKLLKKPVEFVPSLPDESETQAVLTSLKPGHVALLENIRFHPGEERNDARLAHALANLADVYVNEAFSVCHRRVASVVAITRYLEKAAGLRLIREVSELERVREQTVHPFVFILGGAKVGGKLPLLRRYISDADHILLGGALGLQFLAARGETVSSSALEPALYPTVRELLRGGRGKIMVPTDLVETGDIGPLTRQAYMSILREAKLVVWNGPLGVFEDPRYRAGTGAIARMLAKSKARTIVGGGETVSALETFKLTDKFTFVSTGGGAMLEFLEGRTLPGLSALCKSVSS